MLKRVLTGLVLCASVLPPAGAEEVGAPDVDVNALAHAAAIASRCPNLYFDHKRAQDVAIAMNVPAPPRLRPSMQSSRRSMDNRRPSRPDVRPARPWRPTDPPKPRRESPECAKGLALYGPYGTSLPGLLSRRF